ncbi:hypothetical protein I553_5879 [Mycobacterium xenopi 4042]|uniref:Uncharacterized protein n=1 Tax=Mycobacterium xenopi 4042 TaxID=1299334 RepID=X7ZVX6_MYCXE|nr:hypothetical protein I553_5879 [Mycobacterium xenopi 4042]
MAGRVSTRAGRWKPRSMSWSANCARELIRAGILGCCRRNRCIVADRFHTVAARARLGADVAAVCAAPPSSAMPAHWIDSRCAGSSLLSMAWRCRH